MRMTRHKARISRSRVNVDHREIMKDDSGVTDSPLTSRVFDFRRAIRSLVAIARTRALLSRAQPHVTKARNTLSERDATTVPVGPVVPALAAQGAPPRRCANRSRSLNGARTSSKNQLSRSRVIDGDRSFRRDVYRMIHEG